MENEEVVQLYLDDIIPNRFQPREIFNDQALKELAVSIREHGVIQPIIVRKFGDKYEIIAGERRYKASTMAGLTKIPAIVKNLDDKEASKVALIENLQRRDLTPIEEARTYQKILDLDEMTQENLAKTMGKSQASVSNKLRLLSLPDEIQEALLKEQISERHARSLLNVPDRNLQVDLLKEIINNKMTVRELDSKIKQLVGDNQASQPVNENNGGSELFGPAPQVQPEVPAPQLETPTPIPNTSNEVESLFGTTTPPTQAPATESLFGGSSTAPKEPESLFGSSTPTSEPNTMNTTNNDVEAINNNGGVDNNMNGNGLFGNTTPPSASEFFPQNNESTPSSNDSLFGGSDPTTVDINKIRERSVDISSNVPVVEEKSESDINNLLKTNGKPTFDANRFVPNATDNAIEKTEDGNEVIGNGLLAGMPVMKPVDTPPKINLDGMENNEMPSNNDSPSDLFGQPAPSMNNDIPNPNNMNQGLVNDSPMAPSQYSQPIYDTPSQNYAAPQNDINLAVSDIKNLINTYQGKGYKVTVEELNLDNQVQLIVKFDKN